MHKFGKLYKSLSDGSDSVFDQRPLDADPDPQYIYPLNFKSRGHYLFSCLVIYLILLSLSVYLQVTLAYREHSSAAFRDFRPCRIETCANIGDL
jgi:hypothetical protein